jgi:hypothetical protein
MPAYIQPTLSNRNVQQAVPELAAYLIGSLNRLVAPTKMKVTSVQLTSPLAVVGVAVTEGQLPVVGQLVSIVGAAPSYFNVVNAKISAVSFTDTPEDGIGTISFALTNSNIATTLTTGAALAPQVETGETIVTGASSNLALQFNTGPDNGRAFRADVLFPVVPNQCTVTIQGAAIDVDAAYVDIATVATVTGAAVQGNTSIVVDGFLGQFVRFNVKNLILGSGTIVAKVTI